MKKLQETTEENWQFSSYARLEGVTRRVESPSEIFVLLHGLGERGKRIFRKLLPHLPENSLIIAPNGPYLIPRTKDNKTDYGHAWYVFEKSEKKYYITPDLAKFWLRDLVALENPNKLPVTIIGFSQGGYIAPLVGKEIKETKLIIGLSCEFRTTLLQEKLPFPLIAIHGENDQIITPESALLEIVKLKSELGMLIEFHSIKDTSHEISNEMGSMIQKVLENYEKRSL